VFYSLMHNSDSSCILLNFAVIRIFFVEALKKHSYYSQSNSSSRCFKLFSSFFSSEEYLAQSTQDHLTNYITDICDRFINKLYRVILKVVEIL
jgi:hypothetical protein